MSIQLKKTLSKLERILTLLKNGKEKKFPQFREILGRAKLLEETEDAILNLCRLYCMNPPPGVNRLSVMEIIEMAIEEYKKTIGEETW